MEPHVLASSPSLIDLLRDPSWQFWGIAISIVLSIAGIVIPLIVQRSSSRKKITYQFVSDAPVVSIHHGLQSRIKIYLDNDLVEDARHLVLKVRNSGNIAVTDHDYDPPLKFVFEGRKVLSGDVLETDPPHIIDAEIPDKSLKIRSGSPEAGDPGSIFFAPATASCTSGSLIIGGSSALYPLVKPVADDYQTRCPGTHITVNRNSSTSGLYDVQAGDIQIGNSDISELSGQHLVDHPVTVVTYVIVINRGVDSLTSLTTKQIYDIYSGVITNWKQVNGPDLPITVISRTSTSGTRLTFEQYILGDHADTLPTNAAREEVDTTDEVAGRVQNITGAIGYVDVGTATKSGLKSVLINGVQALPGYVENNSYKFWAVEHMYTKGIPDGLTKAFLDI